MLRQQTRQERLLPGRLQYHQEHYLFHHLALLRREKPLLPLQGVGRQWGQDFGAFEYWLCHVLFEEFLY